MGARAAKEAASDTFASAALGAAAMATALSDTASAYWLGSPAGDRGGIGTRAGVGYAGDGRARLGDGSVGALDPTSTERLLLQPHVRLAVERLQAENARVLGATVAAPGSRRVMFGAAGRAGAADLAEATMFDPTPKDKERENVRERSLRRVVQARMAARQRATAADVLAAAVRPFCPYVIALYSLPAAVAEFERAYQARIAPSRGSATDATDGAGLAAAAAAAAAAMDADADSPTVPTSAAAVAAAAAIAALTSRAGMTTSGGLGGGAPAAPLSPMSPRRRGGADTMSPGLLGDGAFSVRIAVLPASALPVTSPAAPYSQQRTTSPVARPPTTPLATAIGGATALARMPSFRGMLPSS